MAGQADGSIIVDTELNSKGFKAGSAELLAAIKSLSNEVKTLGQVLKDTFSSNQGVTATDSKVQALEATITSLRAEVQSLKTQLTELQEKFDNLGGAKIAETPIDGIAESAQKADGEVAELQARIKELEGTISGLQSQFAEALEDPMDVRFDTSAAEAQVSSLESQIEELEAKLQQAQMGAVGSATPTGANVNLNTATGTRSSFERQIESVNSSVERLELNFQRAMSGSESSITAFNTKADALESKIASLRQQLDRLGQAKIPTDQYKALESTVTRLEGKLGQLINRQDKMSAMGVKENSKQWRSLQYEIDETIRKLSVVNAQMSVLRGSRQAYTMGADTAQYQHLSSVLSQASSRLAEMRTALSSTGGPITKLAAGARSVFQWISKAAATLGGKFMSGVSKAVAGVKKLASNARGLRRPLSNLTSSVLRLVPALLMARGMMGILRKAVSAYIAENEKLSITLSACWSGIGNLLGPIISRVISLVATAVAYITKFLSLLGFVGASTKKAISGAGGAAKKETEKLHRQLASFDELNILHQEEDTSGGGGGVADAELPDVTLPDWVEQMVEQLKAGNWAGAATILTDELNRMVGSVDWPGLGDKLAYGMNGALTFLATATTCFNWYNLGTGIGKFLNSVIHGVDWANLGIVLGWKFIALIEGLGGLFATLDWRGLGQALSGCFMGLWNAIDWGQAAQTLSAGIIGALNALSSAIKNVDWQKLGNDIATFIANIDWSEVFTALSDGIGAALGGLTAFLWGLIEDAWNSVVDWWYDVAYKDGQFTMEGLLLGILDAICNIGQWIKTNIFDPFINGFRTAFGIHSPSRVMATQGEFIISGLLQGITDCWKNIPDFFTSSVSSIIEQISSGWDSVGTNICSGIQSGLISGWNWLVGTVRNTALGLLNTAKSVLGIHSPSKLFHDAVGLNIGYGIGEGIEDSETSIIGAVSSIADDVSGRLNDGNYAIGIDIDGKIIQGLDNFADKILNSFAVLMDRMESIANSAEFRAPTAISGLIPYKTHADIADSYRPSIDADEIKAAIETAVLETHTSYSNTSRTEELLELLIQTVQGIKVGDEVIGRAAARYQRKNSRAMGV